MPCGVCFSSLLPPSALSHLRGSPQLLSTPALPLASPGPAHLAHIHFSQHHHKACSSSPSFTSGRVTPHVLCCSFSHQPAGTEPPLSGPVLVILLQLSSPAPFLVFQMLLSVVSSVSPNSHTLNVDHKCYGNIYPHATCEL